MPKVSVELSDEEHRHFQLHAIHKGMKMNQLIRECIEIYLTKSPRSRLTEQEKLEQIEKKTITKSIEKICPLLFAPDERFRSRDFYPRLVSSVAKFSSPTISQIAYLGEDHIHNMVKQKTGTGNAFIGHGEDMYSVRHPNDGRVK